LAPIQVTQHGELIDGNQAAWSNTGSDGFAAADPQSCNDWTIADLTLGRWGFPIYTDVRWTDAYPNNPIGCAAEFRVYCFEQE
ncbi:MAG: hypothetical protein KC636_16750, partial [Myxococcales bacterium]|nr:hypothetical protein [Myxococcales bacterium]